MVMLIYYDIYCAAYFFNCQIKGYCNMTIFLLYLYLLYVDSFYGIRAIKKF